MQFGDKGRDGYEPDDGDAAIEQGLNPDPYRPRAAFMALDRIFPAIELFVDQEGIEGVDHRDRLNGVVAVLGYRGILIDVQIHEDREWNEQHVARDGDEHQQWRRKIEQPAALQKGFALGVRRRIPVAIT